METRSFEIPMGIINGAVILLPVGLWLGYIPLYALLFVRRVVPERDSRRVLYWSLATGWIIQLSLIVLTIVSGILEWTTRPNHHNPLLVHIGNALPMAVFLFGAWFNAVFCYRKEHTDPKGLQRDNTLMLMTIVCLAASVMAIAAARAWFDSSGGFMALEIVAFLTSLWLMVRQGKQSALTRQSDLSAAQRLMYLASLWICIGLCVVLAVSFIVPAFL